jgi:two-component sensor histidine kinase
MKMFGSLQKSFPLAVLVIAGVLLIFLLHFFQNMNEAVLSNQWRVFQLHSSFYKSQIYEENREVWRGELEARLEQVVQQPFFEQLRRVDSELSTTLGDVEHEIRTLLSKPEAAKPKRIDKKLSVLQDYIQVHIDRQLFTIRMVNNFNAASLLLLMGIMLYLFYRNNEKQEKLEKALEEKDFLIKEVHHRTKNNLAMVKSFLNLQSDKIGNREVVQDLESQISAILTIHRKLYQDDDVTTIHLPRYLHEIVSEIFYSLSKDPITLEVDIDEDVYINPDRAVLLGLIVTELATNAVKHGFSEEEDNIFRMQLREDDGHYHLSVSNSGHPFPEQFDIAQATSLGLVLVGSLVQQLRGSYSLERSPHTTFTISFPRA